MTEKMKGEKEDGRRDFGVCTSHDLAPIVARVFAIPKGFDEEKAFRAAYKAFEKEWRKKTKGTHIGVTLAARGIL